MKNIIFGFTLCLFLTSLLGIIIFLFILIWHYSDYNFKVFATFLLIAILSGIASRVIDDID